MVRPIELNQQRLAEKLIILNDRAVGVMTRLYNIKKACGDVTSKPSFLYEKNYESTIKTIVKKFPNIDTKGAQNLSSIQEEISKSLSLYYCTFVDLLDLKDHVSELLTTIDIQNVDFDITINFDLTQHYLDLVTAYVSLMILLSQVEDRKAVLGLYNVSHEMIHGKGDLSFPRLGQMIVDYEVPLKKLSEEFVPHSKVLLKALVSLWPIYIRSHLSSEETRSDHKFSLVQSPGVIGKPTTADTMCCEILSSDRIEKWVIFGFSLCHSVLNQEQPNKLWTTALQSRWVVSLFRDEIIHVHQYIQTFFESLKGYSKRVSEVKECFYEVIVKSHFKHKERRKFLRNTLREFGLLLTDQPGLLGPKALLVFMLLSRSRDEIIWLLHHSCNPPLYQGKNKSKIPDDIIDRQLPELLFLCEELKALLKKYSKILQRYYVQYLSGYDASALYEAMEGEVVFPEDIYLVLVNIHSKIFNLSLRQIADNETFDFRALRLDWVRLQAYMSVTNSQISLADYKEFASLMDTIVFHSQMLDNVDEMLVETFDLSNYCFYSKKFEQQFYTCLEYSTQNRFIIAFPLICAHFQNCIHELCPEERHHIRDKCVYMVNKFLDIMAKEAKNKISLMCVNQCELNDILLPKHCAPQIPKVSKRKKKNKHKKITCEVSKPGMESYRKNREKFTDLDKFHLSVTELCYAINYCKTIYIWDHKFSPKGYLYEYLENRFSKAVIEMINYNSETNAIVKPTELIFTIKSYMNVLQYIESYVHIDITNVFKNVLLQQTQNEDGTGGVTIAKLYSQWYGDYLLNRMIAGNVCYSADQKAFVSLNVEGPNAFHAEEFTDINELRALAELIGPYGMKMLNENLMSKIASHVQQLEKLTSTNKDVLDVLRRNFNNPDVLKDQLKKLQHVDNLLQRLTTIGIILNFRQLCQSALVDVLEERIPFLMSSVSDLQHHLPSTAIVSEMTSAIGKSCKIDPILTSALKSQKEQIDENQQLMVYLLLIFVAVSIPKLAKNDQSFYKVSIGGHTNNIHCIAVAINNIFGALFTICGNDITEKMKEFLALASSSLLRLGQESDKETTKNRDSVYILLNLIVQESPFLTMDLLESCFPYALIRNAFHDVFKHHMQ